MSLNWFMVYVAIVLATQVRINIISLYTMIIIIDTIDYYDYNAFLFVLSTKQDIIGRA